MIKTHALSQILGVQNQVQICPLYSMEQSTLTRDVCCFVPVFSRLEGTSAKVAEVCNFVPVFSRLEVGRIKVERFFLH